MSQDLSTGQDAGIAGTTQSSRTVDTPQAFFVGREREKELYKKFLAKKTPWVLIITGLGGIGKTTLVHELKAYTLRENSLSGTSVVIIDFAKEKYRKHALNVLEEFTRETTPDCDLQKMNGEFKNKLEKNLDQLARLYAEKEKEGIAESDNKVQQEIDRQRRELALREIDHQRRDLATQLLYAQIETFTLRQLVIMLDTCELLNEPDGVEVGQWMMNQLIPGLHTRMQQQERQCSVVIASRLPPRLNVINRQDQRHLTLPMLDETAVNHYLEHVGMQDSSLRQYVFHITHGHALSVRLIGLIWENQGDKSLGAADLPSPLQAEFSEKALVQSMNERVLASLKSPFKELTEYGVLLRNFDLPMLQAVFPECLPESEALERFNQLIRYPYIEPLGNYRYAFHELVREVLAEKVRDKEHEKWERYHKRALDYLIQVSPNSSDRYYHDLAYDEKQGMSNWQKAIQKAHGRSEQIGMLLQAALDKTLKFTPGTHAEVAYENGRFKYYGAGAQWEETLQCYEDALVSFQQVGNQAGQAKVLQAMGDVGRVLGKQENALANYEKALTFFQQVGNQVGQARVLQAIGDIRRHNELDAALRSYQEALNLFRQLKDEAEEAKVLRVMGDVQQSYDKLDAALRSYQQALALYQEEKDRLERAKVLKTIGDVQQLRKDKSAALESYGQALALFGELKEPTEETNVRQAMEEVQQPESEKDAKKGPEITDLVGRQFGNYHLIRLLGQGGFADVYLGEHVHLNTLAAIKVLRTQLVADDITNFRNEARTIAHLSHPNIVQVLDFGVEGNIPFLVMEYAPNGTLRQRHPRNVAVPAGVVAPYVKQVAAALQYAHNQKLIHRDIKPENMLLGRNNEVLLSDFGIALVTQSILAQSLRESSTSDTAAGTILYMAPEQIQGKPCPASDQYALAVVVYEWLCGVRPFNGSYMEVAVQHMQAPPPSLREKHPTISPNVERVVLTALAKDPNQRFGSVQAFASAFEQACQEEETYLIPLSNQSSSPPNLTGGREHTIKVALHGPSGRAMLGSTVCTIGRAPDNQLVISDPKASWHHAKVRPTGQGYSLVDLGSTNGTFVNDQLLIRDIPRILNPGDTIRIGDVTLTYVVSGAQAMGRSISDGSTVRAGDGYQGPTQPPSHTGYGGGVQQEYPVQALTPPYSNPATPPLNTSPVDSDGTFLPVQPSQQSQPYGQSMPLGASGLLNPPPYYFPNRVQHHYVSPASQQKMKQGLSRRAIMLIVLALLVVIASASMFFFGRNNQAAPHNANVTATAQKSYNNATALAQQNATTTAIAIAQATAHVQATATALQAIFNQSTSGTPVLNDPLSQQDANNWEVDNKTGGGGCAFTGGSYHASMPQAGFFASCYAQNSNFSNFAFQVQMTILKGDRGGIIFRSNRSGTKFYLLRISQEGTYNLILYVDTNGTNARILQSGSSSAIHTNLHQFNEIAVIALGNNLYIYVNKVYILSISDSNYSNGGIGVFAEDNINPTEIAFSNAQVWRL